MAQFQPILNNAKLEVEAVKSYVAHLKKGKKFRIGGFDSQPFNFWGVLKRFGLPWAPILGLEDPTK
jgi:hypothetical protein